MMMIHYLSQYLYLKSLDIPVFSFQIDIHQIVYKYSSASISFASEIGVISLGPVANLIVFILMSILAYGYFYFVGSFPQAVSNFVAFFGVVTSLDPIIILLINALSFNFNCEAISDACKIDYTASDCRCFVGDASKLLPYFLCCFFLPFFFQ